MSNVKSYLDRIYANTFVDGGGKVLRDL